MFYQNLFVLDKDIYNSYQNHCDFDPMCFFYVILFFSKVATPWNIAKNVAIPGLAIQPNFSNWWLYQIWLYHKKVAIHYLAILCKWLYFCFFPTKTGNKFQKKFSDHNSPFRTLNWKLTWPKPKITQTFRPL